MRSILILFFVLSTGCGTILAAKTKPIMVQSTPPGAEVLVNGMPSGVTPATVSVDNHKTQTITVRAPGYADGTCIVGTKIGVLWVVLDIVLTFPIGIIVDAVTNGWSEIDQSTCMVTLSGAAAPPPPPPPPPPR